MNINNLSWKTLAGLVALLGLAAFCIHKGQAEIAYGLIAFCLAQFGQRWAVKGVADKVDATHEAIANLHEKVDIVHSQIVNVARVRPVVTAGAPVPPEPIGIIVVNPPDRPVEGGEETTNA